MRTRKPEPQDRDGAEKCKAAEQPSTTTLSKVVDLLVEQAIKIDALESVLKEINPLVHEFYLGTIENLQAQKTAQLKRLITLRLKSKRSLS